MKKTSIILALVFLLAMSLSSCRSTKPPCPAYSSVDVVQLENVDISK